MGYTASRAQQDPQCSGGVMIKLLYVCINIMNDIIVIIYHLHLRTDILTEPFYKMFFESVNEMTLRILVEIHVKHWEKSNCNLVAENGHKLIYPSAL